MNRKIYLNTPDIKMNVRKFAPDDISFLNRYRKESCKITSKDAIKVLLFPKVRIISNRIFSGGKIFVSLNGVRSLIFYVLMVSYWKKTT